MGGCSASASAGGDSSGGKIDMTNYKPYYVGFPQGKVGHIINPCIRYRNKIKGTAYTTFCGRTFYYDTWFEDGFDLFRYDKPNCSTCAQCESRQTEWLDKLESSE
jgi:hypothetical protein